MNTRTGYRNRKTGLHNHFIGSLIFHALGLALLLSVPLHTGGAGAELIHIVLLDTGEAGIHAVASPKGGPAKGKPDGRLKGSEKNHQDTPVLKKSPLSPAEGSGKTGSEKTEAPEVQESSLEMADAESEVIPEIEESSLSDSVNNVNAPAILKVDDSAVLNPVFIEEEIIQPVRVDTTAKDIMPGATSQIPMEQVDSQNQDKPVHDTSSTEIASEPEQQEEIISTSKSMVLNSDPIEERTIQPVKVNTTAKDIKPEVISQIPMEQVDSENQHQPVRDIALPESASEPEHPIETISTSKSVELAANFSRELPSADSLQKILPLFQEPSLKSGGDSETAVKIKNDDRDAIRQTPAETQTAKITESAGKLSQKKDSDGAAKVEQGYDKKPEAAKMAKAVLSGPQKSNSGKDKRQKGMVNAEQNYSSLLPDLLKERFKPGRNLQQKQSEIFSGKTSAAGADMSLSEGSAESSGKGVESGLADERISIAVIDTNTDLNKIQERAGGEGTDKTGTGRPEKSPAITGTAQDLQPEEKSSAGIHISEALVRKDIKISVISENHNNSIVMGLFRRSAVKRQRRTETFRQEAVPAVFEKTKANINNRPSLRHSIGVTNAEKGIYAFILMNKDEEPNAVRVVFHLFEGKATERVKEYTETEIAPGGKMEVKFILPEALFWDDEERFSGTIEDSSSTTKFHYESGLVWKEKKGQAVSGNEEFIREESFLMSEETL